MLKVKLKVHNKKWMSLLARCEGSLCVKVRWFLHSGFVEMCDNETSKLQCVVCGDVLSNDSMQPLKLKQHLNTKPSKLGMKLEEYVEMKINELKVEQKMWSALTTSEAAWKALCKLALHIAKAKMPFTIAEELIMSCMKDICFELVGSSASNKIVYCCQTAQSLR